MRVEITCSSSSISLLNYYYMLFEPSLHLVLGEAAGGQGFTNVNSCVLFCQLTCSKVKIGCSPPDRVRDQIHFSRYITSNISVILIWLAWPPENSINSKISATVSKTLAVRGLHQSLSQKNTVFFKSIFILSSNYLQTFFSGHWSAIHPVSTLQKPASHQSTLRTSISATCDWCKARLRRSIMGFVQRGSVWNT